MRTKTFVFRGSPADRPYIGHGLLERAAKEYGKTYGYTGNGGGWIYRQDRERPEAQGWHAFGSIRFKSIVDYYTRRLTAFDSFQALLDTHESYYPTILPRTWREVFLADAFDRAMYDRKSPRRAWRGSGGN